MNRFEMLTECDEGLCEECKCHHSISKGTRNHGIVSITEYQKLPNNVLQLAHFCDEHNEKYQIFCKKHDCLCCKKCIIETHNGCKELTDLDDITRHIKSSNAFAELELTLSEFAENVKIIITNREDNIASICKQSKNIEKEIQEMRDNINQHLDKVQDAILKELKTKEEEESNKIRRLLKSLIDKEKEITAHQTNISNIKRYASELQTFLALKNIEKDIAADEHYFQSIVKSDSVNQFELSWKINTALQDMLFDIKKFGDVVVTAEQCNIHYQKQKDKQAQMMVPVKHLTIDSLKPTLLQSFDTKLLFVTGCALLPDCRKVLACSSFNMLRVLNPDNLLEFDIRDFDRVF
ncbi:unnamed protein product [Mytilus edulis]|uniref:B box-type domain-containing protein n=1 Tax=Mytilus edulis TaxID=6550 RepID=A0A8S3SA47_MYTED|nr:unnamed protein product [Mytilus edulis]